MPRKPEQPGEPVITTEPGLVRLEVAGLVHAPREGDADPRRIIRLELPGIDWIESIDARVSVEPGPWGELRDRPQHHLLQVSRERWGDGGWDVWVRPAGDDRSLWGLTVARGRGEGNEVDRISAPAIETIGIHASQQSPSGVGAPGGARISLLNPAPLTVEGMVLPTAGPIEIQLGANLGPQNDPRVPSYGWVWRNLVVEVRGR